MTLRSGVFDYIRLACIAAFLGFLLFIAACVGPNDYKGSSNSSAMSSGEESNMRTLTKEQASQRIDEHIKSAIAALPVKPSLSSLGGTSMECEDPTDHGPRGRYEISETYWLNDIPKSRNREFVDTLYRHWEHNNYRIRDDERAEDDKYVSVEHNDDGFRMSIAQNDDGDLSLGASSPCVWPDGVPPSGTPQ